MDLKHGKVRKQDMSCLMSGQSDDAVCLKTPGGETSGKEIRGIDMDQPVIGITSELEKGSQCIFTLLLLRYRLVAVSTMSVI